MLPPSQVDLRKRAGSETPDTSGMDSLPPQLYRVVEQQTKAVGASGFFGADKAYVLPGAGAGGGVESLAKNGAASVGGGGDDDDDDDDDAAAMVEEARKRKRKADKEKDAKKKKHGDFKF